MKRQNFEYNIEIADNADKTLNKIDEQDHETAAIISDHILRLGEDPYTPRSGVDIDRITHSDPITYRLRIGAQLRVEYTVNDDTHTVTIERIIPVKRRKSDYRR